MKVILCDATHYEIFLNHFHKKDFHFEDKESLQNYFKKIFETLFHSYHIEMNGYYHIHAYMDLYYGMVLEIEKENFDYYDFPMREIDTKIEVEKDCHFLYEVEDPFSLMKEIRHSGIIYHFKNHYYFSMQKELSSREMAYLMEHSSLRYKDTDIILNYGKKLLTDSIV